MEKKVALIFGGSGQDGTLMSELLLRKGYKVYSISRSLKKYIEKKNMILINFKLVRHFNLFFFSLIYMQADSSFSLIVVRIQGKERC